MIRPASWRASLARLGPGPALNVDETLDRGASGLARRCGHRGELRSDQQAHGIYDALMERPRFDQRGAAEDLADAERFERWAVRFSHDKRLSEAFRKLADEARRQAENR